MADEHDASPASGTPPGSPPAGSLAAVAAVADAELEALDRELAEIELLEGQARAEAGRHEQKRAATADRVAALGARATAAEVTEANSQLVALTKRAGVMEAQADVLAGKQKVLQRYRDGVARVREAIGPVEWPPEDAALDAAAGEGGALGSDGGAAAGAAVNRVVLAAQEDLRRDIARAMHDGPAQSLTNIVLQAQIVERLLERDPAAAGDEVRQLTAMVQRTLEATKTFIFDVRPMVLDDLGLVPTLRRVARDRSRRSQVPVEFESLGTDHRLPMDVESGVFRVADEAVAALAGGSPEKITMTLDWGDELELVVRAVHAAPAVEEEAPSADLPAALRAMVDERRARAAATGVVAQLTPAIRRELAARCAALGGRVEFAADGRALTARVPLAGPAGPGAGPS